MQLNHHFTQLGSDFFTPVKPQGLRSPELLHQNPALANDIDAAELLADPALLQWASGNTIIKGSEPLAMNYSGHQFGMFNPELGDGRGLLLGEWRDHNGQLWDLHLKGAGRTPYSRFGDGRAVLRSSIREYLIGEALHCLGVNSTRCLSLVSGSDQVVREHLETAAAVVRVSRSHIRFGSFEQFFYQRQFTQLRQLADYTIERYLPNLAPHQDPYQALLKMAVDTSAEMIAAWQAIGFCHGVMNTDNMSIIGDSFDFGPFAFLDDYQPHYICNQTDQQGRYAFSRQPDMALWNLNALAHALSPLLKVDQIKPCLLTFQPQLEQHYHHWIAAKLGLNFRTGDQPLITQWLDLLAQGGADYHQSFRQLSSVHYGSELAPALAIVLSSDKGKTWLKSYRKRCLMETLSSEEIGQKMDQHNPLYVLRNHLLQQAIDAAEEDDFSEIEQLYQRIRSPFVAHKEDDPFAPYIGPPTDNCKTGPLSCSS